MTATRLYLALGLLVTAALFESEPRALARSDMDTLRGLSIAMVVSSLSATSEDHAGSPKHTNHLIHASSPYLLQHAHNPVDWHEWSEEAFELARKQDKPVFLSIGYAACHWCHVMAHESFENEQMAAILNEHFVCIKVDREERPDVDEIYMAATTAQTGRGGWPMSVFMTPDKKPFFCGTYFPREDGRGRRGFKGLCLDIAKNWKDDRAKLVGDAESLLRRVQQSKRIGRGGGLVDRATISRKADALARSFDDVRGGRRSGRNKFPPTMAMELMLREYALQEEISKPELVDLVELTLTQMARGGIYDQIGGGICRYSTDPRWFAPHFEKMLYDQATVAGVYLSAFQVSGNPFYATTARGIFDYCLRDLQDARGGFYSSRDADSEGEEGKFYVWRRSELIKILGEASGALFCDYYNVTDRGNWHGGQNILYMTTDEATFARGHGLEPARWQQQLATMKRAVFAVREKRIPPGLDDKILTEWNGMFVSVLARAYRVLDEPRYLAAAAKAADFILTEMVVEGRLFRVHRKGRSYTLANAADYANLVDALITLFETTGERRWLTAAEQQASKMIELFHDRRENGFFYTASDAEQLIVRSKNARDSVVPSCNSVAAMNFMRLSIILNRPEWRSLADETMAAFGSMVARGALERMQWAYLFELVPPKEIAIIGDPNSAETKALLAEVYHRYLPNKVVMIATPEAAKSAEALPLIERKTLVRGKPGAYVCRDYKCGLPVNTPEALARQLEGG